MPMATKSTTAAKPRRGGPGIRATAGSAHAAIAATAAAEIAPERDMPGRGTVIFAEAFPNYVRLRETQRAFADVGILLQLQASWQDQGEARPLNATSTSGNANRR